MAKCQYLEIQAIKNLTISTEFTAKIKRVQSYWLSVYKTHTAYHKRNSLILLPVINASNGFKTHAIALLLITDNSTSYITIKLKLIITGIAQNTRIFISKENGWRNCPVSSVWQFSLHGSCKCVAVFSWPLHS